MVGVLRLAGFGGNGLEDGGLELAHRQVVDGDRAVAENGAQGRELDQCGHDILVAFCERSPCLAAGCFRRFSQAADKGPELLLSGIGAKQFGSRGPRDQRFASSLPRAAVGTIRPRLAPRPRATPTRPRRLGAALTVMVVAH